MSQVIYEVYGFRNRERTLPCLFSCSDRERARREVERLDDEGLFHYMSITLPRELTKAEKAFFRGLFD